MPKQACHAYSRSALVPYILFPLFVAGVIIVVPVVATVVIGDRVANKVVDKVHDRYRKIRPKKRTFRKKCHFCKEWLPLNEIVHDCQFGLQVRVESRTPKGSRTSGVAMQKKALWSEETLAGSFDEKKSAGSLSTERLQSMCLGDIDVEKVGPSSHETSMD